MKRLLVVVLLLFACQAKAGLSGKPYIDSLMHEVLKAKEDSNKTNLLLDIAFAYYAVAPDSALKYVALANKAALAYGPESGVGLAYYVAGISYSTKAQYNEALANFFNALKIFEAASDKNKKYLGRTYEGIGAVYMNTNFLAKALEYQLSALKIREELGNNDDIAGNLSNIGNVYYMQHDLARALEYYLRAQKLFNKLGNREGRANCLINVGCVYHEQHRQKEAIVNFTEAMRLFEDLDNKPGVAVAMGDLGEAYVTLAADTGNTAGSMLSNKRDYTARAIFYLQKAIAISREFDIPDNIVEFSQYLSRAYELEGNYKAALENYKSYTQIKDSILSNSSRIKIANLETERNLDKQRTQIALNKAALEQKQTETKLYITGIAFLISIMAYVLRKFLRQIRSNRVLSRERMQALEKVEAQSHVLTHISHVQAHEVRGPITTILGLVSIFNHDDPADPMNKELLDDIADVTLRLDKTVQSIIREENDLAQGRNKE